MNLTEAQKSALTTLLNTADRLDSSFLVVLAQSECPQGFQAGCSWDADSWESATEVLWVFLDAGREDALRFLRNL